MVAASSGPQLPLNIAGRLSDNRRNPVQCHCMTRPRRHIFARNAAAAPPHDPIE
jgi:hypothetical protein